MGQFAGNLTKRRCKRKPRAHKRMPTGRHKGKPTAQRKAEEEAKRKAQNAALRSKLAMYGQPSALALINGHTPQMRLFVCRAWTNYECAPFEVLLIQSPTVSSYSFYASGKRLPVHKLKKM